MGYASVCSLSAFLIFSNLHHYCLIILENADYVSGKISFIVAKKLERVLCTFRHFLLIFKAEYGIEYNAENRILSIDKEKVLR